MMGKKYFIITVDTEGDDLWNYQAGDAITTENAKYISRFQALCDTYGFKPVYLTNYEMAMDDAWVKESRQWEREGRCEIGLHIHAWNTPPEYELTRVYGINPYMTEYPLEIIEQKTAYMIKLLSERYETKIISHRSGRWALNDAYLKVLGENGIRIDCTVTPGLNLSNMKGYSKAFGNDFRKIQHCPYMIAPQILEVPMTTRHSHTFLHGSLKHKLKTIVKGSDLWLRPIRLHSDEMKFLTRCVENDGKSDYVEFMIHSSELMPGGSIYFKDVDAVEMLYKKMSDFFSWISQRGYGGVTLKEYAESQVQGFATECEKKNRYL